MVVEIQALDDSQPWSFVDLPLAKVSTGYKGVNKIKYNHDGFIYRYKERLVLKRYIQLERLDYFDALSLVTKITIIRVLLSLATIKDCNLA